MTRRTWIALLTLAGAAFATVTVELLPAGLLTAVAHDLDVAPSRVGLLVTAWALTVAALSLPLERLTRRLPRRRVLAVAATVSAVAALAAAAAPSYEVLVTSRVVAAAAHGLLWALLVPYAASVADERHLGRAVSVVLVGPTAAGVVGVPLGTALAGLVGWRAVMVGAAAVLAAAAVAIRALLPAPSAPVPAAARGEDATGATPTGGRTLARVVVTAGLGAVLLVGHFQVFTYVAPVVTDVAGISAAALGGVLAVFGATGALGLAVAGPLVDRFPRGSLPGTAVAFALTVLAVATTAGSPGLALAAIGAWGAMIGLFPPVFQATVMRLAGSHRDAAGAIVVTALNLGIAVGAASGAWILASFGASTLAPLAAAMIAVAAGGLTVSAVRGARSRGPRRAGGARRPALRSAAGRRPRTLRRRPRPATCEG